MYITNLPFFVRLHIDDAMRNLVEGNVEIKVTEGSMQGIVRIQTVPKERKWDCLITFTRPSGDVHEVELNEEITVHYEDTVNFVGIADFTESKRLV